MSSRRHYCLYLALFWILYKLDFAIGDYTVFSEWNFEYLAYFDLNVLQRNAFCLLSFWDNGKNGLFFINKLYLGQCIQEHKLNVYKTFKRHPVHSVYVLSLRSKNNLWKTAFKNLKWYSLLRQTISPQNF